MKNNQSFFAGQEEVLARISSLIISTVFFLIYIVAREQISINYQSAVVFIGIFWVIYESLSLIMFQLFKYFSNNHEEMPKIVENTKPTNEIISEELE